MFRVLKYRSKILSLNSNFGQNRGIIPLYILFLPQQVIVFVEIKKINLKNLSCVLARSNGQLEFQTLVFINPSLNKILQNPFRTWNTHFDFFCNSLNCSVIRL